MYNLKNAYVEMPEPIGVGSYLKRNGGDVYIVANATPKVTIILLNMRSGWRFNGGIEKESADLPLTENEVQRLISSPELTSLKCWTVLTRQEAAAELAKG